MKLSAHPDRKWLARIKPVDRTPTPRTSRGATPTQSTSKHQPHQGTRECARRQRRIAAARWLHMGAPVRFWTSGAPDITA